MAVEKIINSFKKHQVLIVGDIMIDSYLWGSTTRVSPEAPVPIVNVSKQEHRMGGAANVALNIMSLGATPIMLSVIGDDDMGNIYLDLLKERKMNDVGIVRSTNRKTSQKTRVISHNQHIVRIDNETVKALDKEDEDKLIKKLHFILSNEKIDVVILEDYNKGVLTPRIIHEVIEACNQKNIPSAVDPKKEHFFEYSGVTLFKML